MYEHWWRGELAGAVGIFPVNYVEPLPDPTPEQIEREVAMENAVLAQVPEIDRLLARLHEIDPSRDNVADDDELQELYQKTLHIRPQLIRLIERYSSRVAQLRQINERFVQARSEFDKMMERILARHEEPPAYHGTTAEPQNEKQRLFDSAQAQAAAYHAQVHGQPVPGPPQ